LRRALGFRSPNPLHVGSARPPDPSLLKIIVTRGAEGRELTVEKFDDFDFKNGDRLEIRPRRLAERLLKTPDGDWHIRAADGKGIRVPATMELAEFMGYRVPVHLARLTGAGVETFAELGKAHVANYKKYVGLAPGMSFLEIGSGMGRDAFQLIGELGPQGRYIGIDVQRESIVWCQKNITRDHPNFEFVHFDAIHELHNPYGAKTTMDFPLPAADRSIDRVALQSVLTHIFEDEVVHYLSEIARVLKPGGLAYVTFLLYSPEIVAASRKNRLTRYGLTFEHKYADGCYVDNAQFPTGGVAYTEEAMHRMIDRAGLKLVRPFLKGKWSGYHAQPDDDGQDVAILTPATADA
jgi:SAM-dependent methyltransferase